MSKVLPLILIVIAVLAIYLNRSYARIYEHNGYNLTNPKNQSMTNFKNPNFQNIVKYVAMGDSLSAGVGSEKQEETLPYIFAQKLSQNMSVNMVNLAVSGATSKDLIDNQLQKAIEEKPNYITLFIGTNDVHDMMPEEDFHKNLNFILDELTKKTSAKIIVLNLAYLGSDQIILPPYNTYFDLRTRQFNNIIEKESKARDLTLINLYTPTKNKFSKEAGFYSEDQFHPSGKGYIMWGSLFDESTY